MMSNNSGAIVNFDSLAVWTTIGVPLILILALAAALWQYVRLLRKTLGESEASADHSSHSISSSPKALVAPLVLQMLETSSLDGRAESPELSTAHGETRAMRLAFVVSGVVYILLAAVIVFAGELALRGFSTAARAVALTAAYASTAGGVILVLAFIRARLLQFSVIVTTWSILGLLLLIGLSQASVRWKEVLLLSGWAAYVAVVSLVIVALLLTIRQLPKAVLSFAPIVLVWTAMVIALTILLRLFVPALILRPNLKVHVWPVFGGFVNICVGLCLAVWHIRRGLPKAVVAFLAMMIASGLLLFWVTRSDPHWFGVVLLSVPLHTFLIVCMWWLFQQFARLLDRGWLTDELLQFHFCWFCLSYNTTVHLRGRAQILALFPFAIYLWTQYAMLYRQRRAAERRRAKRLLFLRVFGQPRPHRRLLDVLDDTWRRVGRIDLVVGNDVALRTLTARTIEQFLMGRASRQFLKNEVEVRQKLAQLPFCLGFDCRYPINELHCLAGTWQLVITQLSSGVDALLLDLRDFQLRHRGATFELAYALQRVPLQRIVLLLDRTTDQTALTDVIRDAWQNLPEDSPNRRLTEAVLRPIRCSGLPLNDEPAIIQAVFTAAFDVPLTEVVRT
jgi:hypothetical protein